MKLPSTKNSTFVTVREPMMLTLALTGTVSLTVEPDDGDVMVTIRLFRNALPMPSLASTCW